MYVGTFVRSFVHGARYDFLKSKIQFSWNVALSVRNLTINSLEYKVKVKDQNQHIFTKFGNPTEILK